MVVMLTIMTAKAMMMTLKMMTIIMVKVMMMTSSYYKKCRR